MKKRIVVTNKDIKDGKAYKGDRCPVALACKRGFKTDDVVVGYAIQVDGKWYPMSAKVSNFTIDFDLNRPVKPFQFIVEI